MAATDKTYSVDEVLNLTVDDLQGERVLDVQDWSELPSEKREACLQKLRDLMHQRARNVFVPVDANKLEEKLKQVSTARSPSPASSFHTPPPDHEADFNRDLKSEKESYSALLDAGGIPIYPVNLILDIFDKNPGDYEDIVSYWEHHSSSGRCLFFQQLKAWRGFLDYQQRVRLYFIPRDRFPEYQQRVRDRRRRHGLQGSVELREEIEKQNKLENWFEYQDLQLQTVERLEKEIEEAQAKVQSTHQAADEAGVPGSDGIFDPDSFGSQLALSGQSNDEEANAVTRRISAQEASNLAKTRLMVAQSDHFGETIGRAEWIKLFLEHVEAAQNRLDEVPTTGCDFDDWHAEGNRHRPEPEDTEEWDKWWEVEDKRREASKKRYNAEFEAWVALQFQKKALQAAQSDDFGNSVERVALINMITGEIEAARNQLVKATDLEEKARLRGKVIGALCGLAHTKRTLARHKILVEWIERQRRAMTTEDARPAQDSWKSGHQEQIKRSQSSTNGKQDMTAPSKPKESRGAIRQKKQAKARSVLGAVDPSRVSKVYGAQTIHRRQTRSFPNASQRDDEDRIKFNGACFKIKQVSKAKETLPSALSPTHSSRISKLGRRKPSATPQANTTKQLRTLRHCPEEVRPRRSFTGTAEGKSTHPARLVDSQLRRSARIPNR